MFRYVRDDRPHADFKRLAAIMGAWEVYTNLHRLPIEVLQKLRRQALLMIALTFFIAAVFQAI